MGFIVNALLERNNDKKSFKANIDAYRYMIRFRRLDVGVTNASTLNNY